METNFKVDAPSFALGYSAGKKKGGSGGGAELNIHYSLDTPPEDTSKLWVKCEKPESARLVPSFEYETCSLLGSRLPQECTRMACAVVGSKAYLFGGEKNVNYQSSYSNMIIEFDSDTEKAEALDTVLEISAEYIAAASVGTKIYLFGGKTTGTPSTLSTIYVFDTETRELYRHSATLPIAANNSTAFSIGSKIYLFGGEPHNTAGRTIVEFDPETGDIETVISKLPTSNISNINDGYFGSACAVIGTKAYLFGGFRGKRITVFDSETKEVRTLEAQVNATRNMGCAVVGTKVYLLGGMQQSSNTYYTSSILKFDTETETITTLNETMMYYMGEMASASFGLKTYLFGGRRSSSASGGSINYMNYICRYSGSEALAENHVAVSASLTENVLELQQNVTIGAKKVYKGDSNGVGDVVEAAIYRDGEWTNI